MVPDSIRIAPPAFDALTAYGIGGLAVAVAAAFVLLFSKNRPARRLALAAAAAIVMAGSAAAASSGLLARFDRLPPPMLIMIVSVFAIGFVPTPPRRCRSPLLSVCRRFVFHSSW